MLDITSTRQLPVLFKIRVVFGNPRIVLELNNLLINQHMLAKSDFFTLNKSENQKN
uniref:Uncharacterized protein n=1 Tax=Meloidogyne incognita TaxID=6306 RepID=A0A914MWC4_MELIC